MMIRIPRKAFATAVAAALYFPAQNAMACDCSPAIAASTAAITLAISTSTTAITGAISAQTTSLQNAFSRLITTVEGSANKQIEASRDIQSASTEAEREMKIGLQRTDTMRRYQLAKNACATARSAGGGVAIRSYTGGVSRVGTAAAVADGVRAPAPSVSQSTIDATGKALANSGYSNADVNADSLFKGYSTATAAAAGADAALEQPIYTDIQLRLARLQAKTAIDPIPPAQVPDAYADTAAGRAYNALVRARAAKISFAHVMTNDYIAARTPGPNTASLLKVLSSTDSGQKWAAANQARFASGVSTRLFDQIEVDRRYGNPQWYVDMSSSAPEAVAREQLFLSAQQANQLNQVNLKLEKLGLLLAGLTATLTDQVYLPRVESSWSALSRAGRSSQ
jgi:hypothetical protein